MPEPTDITRTVAIEHAGEKIHITVHVHLTSEEIRRVLAPAVSTELAHQMSIRGKPYPISWMPVEHRGKQYPKIDCLGEQEG